MQQQQQQQAWGSYSLSLTLCSLPLSPFSLPCLGELRPAILNNDPARSSCARRELTKLSPRTSERTDGRTDVSRLYCSTAGAVCCQPVTKVTQRTKYFAERLFFFFSLSHYSACVPYSCRAIVGCEHCKREDVFVFTVSCFVYL